MSKEKIKEVLAKAFEALEKKTQAENNENHQHDEVEDIVFSLVEKYC